MKYLVLLLLLISNIAQAQMSCAGLFAGFRPLTEEEIDIRIEELVRLKSDVLNSGDAIKRIAFTDRFNILTQIVPREEVVRRMKEFALKNSVVEKEAPVHQQKNLIQEALDKVGVFAIENGVDLNDHSQVPQLMHMAAHQLRHDLIQPLIMFGIDINVRNRYAPFYTALQESAHNLNANIKPETALTILELLKNGADINIRDSQGKSFLEIIFTDKSAHLTPEVLKAIIDGGVNITAKDSQGNTFLHYYANRSIPDHASGVIDIFAQNGIDINSRNRYGKTPLDLAVETNKEGWNLTTEKVIEILKSKGAGQSKFLERKRLLFWTDAFGLTNRASRKKEEKNP